MFWNSKVFLHLIYFAICSAGIARSSILLWQRPYDTQASLIEDGVIHVGWPPLLWLVCLNSIAIPVRYTFLPSTIPHREQILKRGPLLRASSPQGSESAAKILSYSVRTCVTLYPWCPRWGCSSTPGTCQSLALILTPDTLRICLALAPDDFQ